MRGFVRRLSKFGITLSLFVQTVGLRQIGGRTDLLPSNTQARKDAYIEAPVLALGESINQELSGSERYSYKIALGSGEYLRILVSQSGIEVGMTLYTPDGRKLSEFICRRSGPTPVSVIAGVAGTYRLEVHSLEKDPAQGRYGVRVEELRPATAHDIHRIAAEKAFAKAEELRKQWRADSSRSAIKRYEEARQHWRTAGEQVHAATCLRNVGETYLLLGEPRTALNFYRQALMLNRTANDRKGETETLNGIAEVYLKLGENLKAMESCSKALTLSRANDDRQGEALALIRTGNVHYAGFGDLPRSLEYYDQALARWSSLGNRGGQAEALLNSGFIHSDLGEAQKASDFHNRALSLFRSLGDRRGEAQTLTAIGHLQSRLGEKQEALDLLNRALELVRPMGDKVWEAAILSKLGWTLYQMGEKERSLDYYRDGLSLYQAINFRIGEAALLAEMGKIYYSSGENQKALDHYNRALLLSRAVGDRQIESIALRNMGVVYEALGQKVEALKYGEQALSLNRACGDRRAEAYTLQNLGQLYEGLGKVAESIDYYRRALLLSRATQDRVAEALALCNTARAERGRGNLTEARSQLEEALKIIESLRTKVVSQELRSSYFASERHRYDLYIDLLMQMHQQHPSDGIAADALQASERVRARSLVESLTEARADIRQGIDPALLERERSLQHSLSAKADRQMRLLSGKPDKQEVEALAKEIRNLAAAYEELQAQIRSESPRYAALTQPQPLSLKEIQEQVLDDNSLLLEYALGDEHSYLWVVTQTSIKSYELPKRAEIERLGRHVYDLLVARQPKPRETVRQHQARVSEADAQYWVQAAALSQTLLGPAVETLGTKRLLIVAEGALQYLPFGALPKPRPHGESSKAIPLVMDHEIVPLPSASVMGVLRRESHHRQAPAKTVAVLADPVFDTDDPRLAAEVVTRLRAEQAKNSKSNVNGTRQPKAASSFLPASRRTGLVSRRPSTPPSELHRTVGDLGALRDGLSISRLPSSRLEAKAIIAVTPPGQGMMAIGFNASRALATSSELSQYRMVHFATHGVLNDQHPGLSGVILSLLDEQGRPQDGFLRLHDIYNLNLPADLVVLSACNTALGKDVRGEGLVGIVRGFMYAGASRVVASLWKVDDDATAELMKRFYRHMLQNDMPAAAALRAAQIEMSEQKQWRSPYYWAAFVLQGEWK
jgi:CHAT domain-containing protein